MQSPFFRAGDPPLTSNKPILRAEQRLDVRLPRAYVALLKSEHNGGWPLRCCFRVNVRTSWARDHIAITTLHGVGNGNNCIDGDLGSRYMIREWGYPDVGVVLCSTPSGGHDTVMLDYRACGPWGEPSVIYVDDDNTADDGSGSRKIVTLAPDFATFANALVDCKQLA